MKIRVVIAMGMTLAGSLPMIHAEQLDMPPIPGTSESFDLAQADMEAASGMPEAAEAKESAKTPAVYVCPDDQHLAMKAGECPKCKKETKEMHLLGVQDGGALLCACGAGCACDAQGMKDGKCACGKEVMKVSSAGLYTCPNGCPALSENPGTCACGMEMKKAE